MTADIRMVGEEELRRLASVAREGERRRTNLNLHAAFSDPVQRFLNVLQPGTYVPPHYHLAPDLRELFALLEGRAAVLLFEKDGVVAERIELGRGGTRLVEVPAGRWHALVALAPDTILLEVKPGPYDPARDKVFAPWAPREGEKGAERMVGWMEKACRGERPPMFS